jgi:hypothetical protein
METWEEGISEERMSGLPGQLKRGFFVYGLFVRPLVRGSSIIFLPFRACNGRHLHNRVDL